MPLLFEGINGNGRRSSKARSATTSTACAGRNHRERTVAAFAERTAALTKSLTDTILAAVAVLIGSFIAAAFATPFNATLFRIGVLTYAGYVSYFLEQSASSRALAPYGVARAEFNTRIGQFNEILFPENVSDIVGSRVSDAQRSYYRWLSFVAVTYVAVAIAAGVGAAQIPNLIAR